MISPHIRFDHLDPTAWRRVHHLLAPPRPGAPASARSQSPMPLVLFIEKGQCVKALRPGTGRLDPKDFPWSGTFSLGRHRRTVGAPIAFAVEDDALDRIAAVIDRRLLAGDDLAAQLLEASRAGRAELGRGVHVDPDVLGLLPVPSYAALQKTFDTLVPDDRSIALFLFDSSRGDPWCSLIIAKQGGDAVRVTTHAALGVRAPDFRGGRHKELLMALESKVARPHAALFATLDAWREIVGPEPGALATQVALGRAVIDPAPPWVVALTGAGAVAGVAQIASSLFGRFVPQAVKDTARAMSPFAALGFDPIEAFMKIRRSF